MYSLETLKNMNDKAVLASYVEDKPLVQLNSAEDVKGSPDYSAVDIDLLSEVINAESGRQPDPPERRLLCHAAAHERCQQQQQNHSAEPVCDFLRQIDHLHLFLSRHFGLGYPR